MLDKLYLMKYNEDNKKQERKKTKEQTKRKNKNLQNMVGGPMGY